MDDLQNKLNQYALIVRKYSLGDKKYFVSKFPYLDKSKLKIAWTFAQSEIQNNEIIKNASHLTIEEFKLAFLKINAFDYNTIKLYEKLNSKFDEKEFKLTDENVERKVRYVLALRLLQNIANEINELKKDVPKSFKSKFVKFADKIKYGLIAVAIVGVFAAPRIIDGLTPVDVLTEKIHENSKYEFNGSICNDHHTSHSQGRGTCSWHGGVAYTFYKGDYSETIEESRAKATKLSWRD